MAIFLYLDSLRRAIREIEWSALLSDYFNLYYFRVFNFYGTGAVLLDIKEFNVFVFALFGQFYYK